MEPDWYDLPRSACLTHAGDLGVDPPLTQKLPHDFRTQIETNQVRENKDGRLNRCLPAQKLPVGLDRDDLTAQQWGAPFARMSQHYVSAWFLIWSTSAR